MPNTMSTLQTVFGVFSGYFRTIFSPVKDKTHPMWHPFVLKCVYLGVSTTVMLLLTREATAQIEHESRPVPVVVLRNVRTLSDLLIAEEDWVRQNLPGSKVLGITYPSGIKTNNLDVISFELNRRRGEVTFKYSAVTNSGIGSIWEPCIARLTHSSQPVIAAQFLRLKQNIMAMPLDRSLPYLFGQLDDKRPIYLQFEPSERPNMRVCDLVVCYYLKDLRSKSSNKPLFPEPPCEHVMAKEENRAMDKAIVEVQRWWAAQGHRLLKEGEIDWSVK